MQKLNNLQYPEISQTTLDSTLSLEPLKNNFEFNKFVRNFKMKYDFNELNTFSFTSEGLIGFMGKLKGKIAVSKGESQAIINAAEFLITLGKEIIFIDLNKDGSVNLEQIKQLDSNTEYIFISSYVMDTFYKTNLEKVKSMTEACIISNVSASQDQIHHTDIALFDAYKLTGFQLHSVVLHNGELNEQFLGEVDYVGINQIFKSINKEIYTCTFKNELIETLKKELNDDIFFFVEPNDTLQNSLHIGLKNIKAREIIRTLSLDDILVTNGEGCSLGLSKPSRIIQEMGYSELESRQALSLSFTKELSSDEILYLAKIIAKKYRHIKAFND